MTRQCPQHQNLFIHRSNNSLTVFHLAQARKKVPVDPFRVFFERSSMESDSHLCQEKSQNNQPVPDHVRGIWLGRLSRMEQGWSTHNQILLT